MNREGYSRTEKSSDLYQTPKYFYKLLDNIFHFTLFIDNFFRRYDLPYRIKKKEKKDNKEYKQGLGDFL